MIACGALGAHLREIIARRGWPAELHCLPALLHNRPEKITIHAERLARAGLARGQRVAVAYADCGTYGALDEVCARLGLRRLGPSRAAGQACHTALRYFVTMAMACVAPDRPFGPARRLRRAPRYGFLPA